LGYALLIDYYRLRFQLEFNFRDAKQYWGLEDFMSVNERPVHNSANLAMLMVNVSHALIRPMRAQWPELSVNDLKAWFRGRKYVVETLKLLPEMPDDIFIDQVVSQMAVLGRVNHVVNSVHRGLISNASVSIEPGDQNRKTPKDVTYRLFSHRCSTSTVASSSKLVTPTWHVISSTGSVSERFLFPCISPRGM
jgi:hypothetical protein